VELEVERLPEADPEHLEILVRLADRDAVRLIPLDRVVEHGELAGPFRPEQKEAELSAMVAQAHTH